jgi:hypothetical protein
MGNSIIRYNEKIIAYAATSGVRINNILQKLCTQHPQVDKWQYRVFND